MARHRNDITALLAAHARGDEEALDRLFELVYDELRRVARAQRRRLAPRASLETHELVNELYLKLAGGEAALGSDRGQFLAVVATAMRHLIVDTARHARRRKRGGGLQRVTLSRADRPIELEVEKILGIHHALEKLGQSAPRQVRVVECRYFLGLSEDETAAALRVSQSTVQRDWRSASHWLARELRFAGREALA